mmetsp:Transcript_50529/g.159933  ORF Transcript_50529/g.159933 Transcript_50529/m.159933 type:complete len:226 (+) Transcript_50529:110-787(+)
MSRAWKVTWRQQQPIPYAIASISMPRASSAASVFASRSSGARMSTLEPRRRRMLRVSAWKRGSGVMRASGALADSVASLPAAAAGSAKSPTPRVGKAGMVIACSSGRSTAASRFRRSRMLCSTRRRSAVYPPYGTRGVPSTIHAPYSGCHEHASPNPSRRPNWCSFCRSTSSTSSARSATLAVFCFSSRRTRWYSISSPQRSSSLVSALLSWNIATNCCTPCSRT